MREELYLINQITAIKEYLTTLMIIRTCVILLLFFTPNKRINKCIPLLSIPFGITVGVIFSCIMLNWKYYDKLTFIDDIREGKFIVLLFVIFFLLMSFNSTVFNRIQLVALSYLYMIGFLVSILSVSFYFIGQFSYIIILVCLTVVVLVEVRNRRFNGRYVRKHLIIIATYEIGRILINSWNVDMYYSSDHLWTLNETVTSTALYNFMNMNFPFHHMNDFKSVLFLLGIYLCVYIGLYICKRHELLHSTKNKSVDIFKIKPITDIKKILSKQFLLDNKIYIETIVMTVISIVGVIVSIISIHIDNTVSNIEKEQLTISKSSNIPKVDVVYNNMDQSFEIINFGGKIYDLNVEPIVYLRGFSKNKLYILDLFDKKYVQEKQGVILTARNLFYHLDSIVSDVGNEITNYNNTLIDEEVKIILEKYIIIQYIDYEGIFYTEMYEVRSDVILSESRYVSAEGFFEGAYAIADEDQYIYMKENEEVQCFVNRIVKTIINMQENSP